MTNRQRQKANELRRAEAARKQYPLPAAEQARRAAAKAAAYAWRYPKAPNYESPNRSER